MSQSVTQSLPPELLLTVGKTQQPLSLLAPIWLETHTGVNQIPSARLVLSAANNALLHSASLVEDDISRCVPGSEIRLSIKSGPTLFAGIVVQQSLRVQKDRSELTLTVKHPLQRLAVTQQSQVFVQRSDADILRTLCSARNIPVKKLDGMGVLHEQMVQFSCSDWQFMKARLAANGVWLLPEPDGISVVKPSLSSRPEHTLSASDTKDASIEEAEWSFSSLDQPQQLAVSAWDLQQQSMSRAASATPLALGSGALDPGRLTALTTQTWLLANSLPLAADEQQALASGRLLAQQAAAIQGRFMVMGSSQYQPGQTLALSGFSKSFNGSALITGVQHHISKGVWRTTLSIGQPVLRDVDAALVPPAVGLHIGIVDSYQQDPDNLNRLRVKAPMLMQDSQALWARFSAPYASKESGLCLYPEEGDEVVLGFFAEDPRYPVILGAMHNPKNLPPYPPSSANNQKALIMGQGNHKQQLLFDTQNDSASLEVGKDSLKLHQGIQLGSDKDMVMSAQNLTLGAKHQLDAKGSAGVKIQGAKVDLTN